MPSAVRDGTFFTVTPRPPNRLPDPGRICIVVTPPASASSNCGSCGQIECSAQTSAVSGLVISLPSCSDSMPAPEYTPRCECVSMMPGVTHLPLGVDHDRVSRRVDVLPDSRDLAVLQQDRSAFDRRTRRGQDRRVPDDGRLRRQRLIRGGVGVRHPGRNGSFRRPGRRGLLRPGEFRVHDESGRNEKGSQQSSTHRRASRASHCVLDGCCCATCRVPTA